MKLNPDCQFCDDGTSLFKEDVLYQHGVGPKYLIFEAVKLNYCPRCGKQLKSLNKDGENNEQRDSKKIRKLISWFAV